MWVVTLFVGGIIGPFSSEKKARYYLDNYLEGQGRGNVQMLVAVPDHLR